MKKIKKVLSVALSIFMLISVLPINAFAAAGNELIDHLDLGFKILQK